MEYYFHNKEWNLNHLQLFEILCPTDIRIINPFHRDIGLIQLFIQWLLGAEYMDGPVLQI